MDNYITKFALSCLTINCIIIKIFTDLPIMLLNDAGSGAVTALWLSAVIGIIIISIAYMFRSGITSLITRKSTARLFACLVFAYFVCLDIYFLYKTVDAVHSTIYHNMPILLILIIMIIGMLYIGMRNIYSITRLHSICVPVIVLGIIAVVLSGFKYTDPLNAAPILGSGPVSVFSVSLKHLFAFSEVTVPVLMILFSSCKKSDRNQNSGFSKVILISAIAGILIYSAVLTILFLTIPSSSYSEIGLPLHYMSKFSAAGRLNVRTDAIYTLALTAAAVLYTGSTLYIIIESLKKIGITKKFSPRCTTVGTLAAVFGAMSLLSGCAPDAREVENTAFIIAIGADVSSNPDKQLSFTFQFTNPLATGKNTNMESGSGEESEKSSGTDGSQAEGSSDKKEEGNTTVDNIRIESDNFYEALNRITNHIGKQPSLAHIKLLALSEDIAYSEQNLTETICSDLLKANEIRPETSVCVIKDQTAAEYLTSVNPSLEESTARHYELMFDKNSTFDSVQTDLRTFAMNLGDNAVDAYAPFVTKDGFSGTVIFSENRAAAEIDSENSRLMNMIFGNVKKADLFYTDKDNQNFRLKQSSHPKIKTTISNKDNIYKSKLDSTIELTIDAEPIDKNGSTDTSSLSEELNENADKLLNFVYSKNSDVFAIGKSAKASLKYENEWQSIKQYIPVHSYNITPKINVNFRD